MRSHPGAAQGLADLAAFHLGKAGISAIRRIRKTDNNRCVSYLCCASVRLGLRTAHASPPASIARATGATIVNRPEELKAEDIGTKAGLFEVKQLGDDYFTFIVDCEEPKACTIILRGASKDVLNEVERNLTDAMGVARNVVHDPRLLPGGGAVEMAVSRALAESAPSVQGVEQWPYRAVGVALEVIPRTLAQNCGANVIRTLTKLRAKHAEPANAGQTFGIDGHTGAVVDMKQLGIWEPYAVKVQTIKTAVESAAMLLRIDDIVSGLSKKGGGGGGGPKGPEIMKEDQGGDEGPAER